MKEPWFKPANIMLLYEGKDLASMACILPRIMNLDGFTLKLAGIGGVATAPEFRGKGYAAEVMKESVRQMEKRGYGLSLLYPYKSAFYEQFGYRNITIPFKVIDTAKTGKPECKYSVRKLAKPDYAGLKKVYDIFNKSMTGTIKRPLPYWKNYCEYWVNQAKKMCWKEDPFFCAYQKGSMAAYIRVSTIRKTWEDRKYSLKISEFACLAGHEKAFECLIYAARRHAERLGFKKLYFENIRGIDIHGSRRPSKTEKAGYMNLKHVKMYRICSFPALMRVLGTAFNRRLRQAGIRGSWRNFIGIKRVVTDSQPRVFISSKSRSRTLLLDEGEFIKLVLGLKTIKNDVILRALFPLLKPVYWDFDYL
jgi:hypothetical protein